MFFSLIGLNEEQCEGMNGDTNIRAAFGNLSILSGEQFRVICWKGVDLFWCSRITTTLL